MTALTRPTARATLASDTPAIDTIRAIAVLLLVSYHVIGSSPDNGLRIGYPHALRLWADFLVDLRMPLFAFVAGYVYAMRPVVTGDYAAFLAGKLRRLVLPGMVAIVIFLLTAHIMGTQFALPAGQMWKAFLMPYAHFWFLQSILLIFAVFGLVDAVLKGRFALWILLLSGGLYLNGYHPPTSVMSVGGAIYLLPYFMLGVVFLRHRSQVRLAARPATPLLLIVLVVCAAWNMGDLMATGTFSAVRRDVQSLLFGLAACSIIFLWCPPLPLLARLCPYAFTIYLYHIHGTAGARMVGDALGLEVLELRFGFGLLGGLLAPVLLHRFLVSRAVFGRSVLGLTTPQRTFLTARPRLVKERGLQTKAATQL